MVSSMARGVIALAAVLGGAAGCAAAPHLTPVTITPGCYAVNADRWPTALVAQTGIEALPGFIALDTIVAGPLGRRVVLPPAWRDAPPYGRTAYWTETLHVNRPASLEVRFRGPGGDFVASLEAAEDGYAGTGASPAPGGASRQPRVGVALTAISCANLRLDRAEPTD